MKVNKTTPNQEGITLTRKAALALFDRSALDLCKFASKLHERSGFAIHLHQGYIT